MAPLLDGRNVNLQSGSASFGVPITVPAGQGGLTPNLTLTYDSGRLGEMRGWASVGSWVGIGWDLDVPHISISQNEDNPSTGNHTHRVFLAVDGFGGEIMQDYLMRQDGDGYLWHATNEQYVKIRSSSQSINGAVWTVWDKSGTKYVFGGGNLDSQYRRYYRQDICDDVRDYRADVKFIEDVHGNRIDFEYWQQKYNYCGPGSEYVMAAYPWKITYNDGQAQLEFHRGTDECVGAPLICTRFDVPRDVHDGGCPEESEDYFAPPVMEIRKLNQIEVKVSGALVRRYDFSYDTTPFGNWGGCPPVPAAGEHKLTQLIIRDRNFAAYPFTTTKFFYGSEHFAFHEEGTPIESIWDYNWKHLQRIENGMGGEVQFDYAEEIQAYTFRHWSISTVSEQRTIYGAGQPDVVRSIEYNNGPYQYNYPDPYKKQSDPNYVDEFRAAKRGFQEVTEFDQGGEQGNYVKHQYFATSNSPSGWSEEVLTGREHTTTSFDANDGQWKKVETEWLIRQVDNPFGSITLTNFVAPESTTTTLRDGTELITQNAYDAYGNLSEQLSLGAPGAGDDAKTLTPFHHNTAAWIFAPKYTEVVDPATSAQLRRTNLYYDGANSAATLPTKGLVTATSAKVDSNATSNTYVVYDAYGNPIQASNPTASQPEGETPGGSLGWMPAGTPYSTTSYDATHHVFPVSQTNALGHVTTTDYDFVLGKPVAVHEPTGRTTQIRYDQFGRPSKAWDNFDSETYPTVQFTYTWGTIPNRTQIDRRTFSGTNYTFRSQTCMDGFGREVERAASYISVDTASVRTDYDARGLKSVVSARTHMGSATVNCPTTPSPMVSRDRDAYTYDPLGNVVVTKHLAANQSTGPQSTANYNGLTTTVTDEKGNATTHVRDLDDRRLAVYEPGGISSSTVLRPNGQGAYAEWDQGFPLGVPHYQTVDDVAPDDDGSYVARLEWYKKDTFTFPGANLPTGTVIDSVNLRFRWKHWDGYTPNPGAPVMWALMRQSGVDTQGPTYHSTNQVDWRNHHSWEMTTNPRTGQPWTLAEVNAARDCGFEVHPTGGARPYVTEVFVEIRSHSTAAPNTTYQHDRVGQLTGVTDAAGNVTSLTYDLGGRKKAMTDPDMGPWTYSYTVAGDLTSQTDARGVVTNLGYDALRRLTAKTYSNGDAPVAFLYDSYPDTSLCPQGVTAIGKMTRMRDGAGEALTCYDARGRSVKDRRTILGASYETSREYNSLDQLLRSIYPDGEDVRYNRYLDGGQLWQLKSETYGDVFGTSMLYKPFGAMSQLTLGTGQTKTYTYDARQRLTGVQAGSAQNVTLTYDDASNVQSINDGGEVQTFSYDQLNRLTGMSINSVPSATYAYDSLGNLLTKQEGSSSLALTYPGIGAPRPHAAIWTSGTQGLSLTYDANGNLASQGTSTYAYDAENRLRSRDTTGDGASLHTYDGTGSLLRRTQAGAQQAATLRPSGQGFFGQWSATPNVAHYLNIDEVAADDDATQISRSGAYDSHTYPSAGVPANAVVEQVLLRLRWKAVNGTVGAVVPFFRQNGANGSSQWFVSLDANWKDDVLSLQHNPVTGKAWTAADVNASMEFGFVGQFAGYSPRVTQAYVEVKYRVPASSTDYVGGIYEKQSDGTETKYYDAGGATAMRVETTAGGTPETGANCQNTTDDDGDTIVNDGCPVYLLADHLGGTTKVVNSSGAVVSELKYWPYGAVRDGAISQTDKLYTGQQQEPGDAALGLYNYKARFYSTTLGRFVSADSLVNRIHDPQSMNRYSYVRNLPTSLIDPTGHCFLSISGDLLDCSADAAESWFDCAMGGCGGDPMLEAFAKQGISQWLYWSNVSLLMESGTVSLHILQSFVTYAGVDPDRWNQMPNFGWRYLAVTVHVPEAYFKASLFALMYGDTSRIAQLDLGGIAGGYAWWDRNDLAWGINSSAIRGMFTVTCPRSLVHSL